MANTSVTTQTSTRLIALESYMKAKVGTVFTSYIIYVQISTSRLSIQHSHTKLQVTLTLTLSYWLVAVQHIMCIHDNGASLQHRPTSLKTLHKDAFFLLAFDFWLVGCYILAVWYCYVYMCMHSTYTLCYCQVDSKYYTLQSVSGYWELITETIQHTEYTQLLYLEVGLSGAHSPSPPDSHSCHVLWCCTHSLSWNQLVHIVWHWQWWCSEVPHKGSGERWW